LIIRPAKKLLHFVTANADRRLKHCILRKINAWRRNKQFTYVLEHHPVEPGRLCPICSCNRCRTVTYYFEQNRIDKAFCPNCLHLFSSLNLPGNIPRAKQLFDYHTASPHSATEIRLIELLVEYSGKTEGRFLDFGIGGNLAALQSARLLLGKKYQIWGCDLVNRNDIPQYFITYQNDDMLGSFDGICSSEVLEHLDNTIESWSYLNRLLQPVDRGGGLCCTLSPAISRSIFRIL